MLSWHQFHSGKSIEAANAAFLDFFQKSCKQENTKCQKQIWKKNMWYNKMFQLAVLHAEVDSCPSLCNNNNIYTWFFHPNSYDSNIQSVTLVKIATWVCHNFCDSNTRISLSVTILMIATLIFACMSQILQWNYVYFFTRHIVTFTHIQPGSI